MQLSTKATKSVQRTKIKRVNTNSRLFKTIISAIQEKKGTDILSLDLRKIDETVADFFIICQANNPQQLKAITENIEEKVKQHCSESPYSREGLQAAQWSLLDYITIVAHVMLKEPRAFYSLEEMWNDALIVQHPD